MTLTSDKKRILINGVKLHEKDTGSSRVQITLLTERINLLTEHFKLHKKDHHSRRGLLKLVSKRKKLLTYLKDHNPKFYTEITNKLNIRT